MKKVFVFVCVLFSLECFFLVTGISVGFNTSPSMPIGVYFLKSLSGLKADKDLISRGDIITFCPETHDLELFLNRGYLNKTKSGACEFGTSEFVKTVLAVAGDKIEVKKNMIFLNGKKVQNSEVLLVDKEGRLLPRLKNGWTHLLKKEEFFVFADGVKTSLDSRYLGIIKKSMVREKSFFNLEI